MQVKGWHRAGWRSGTKSARCNRRSVGKTITDVVAQTVTDVVTQTATDVVAEYVNDGGRPCAACPCFLCSIELRHTGWQAVQTVVEPLAGVPVEVTSKAELRQARAIGAESPAPSGAELQLPRTLGVPGYVVGACGSVYRVAEAVEAKACSAEDDDFGYHGSGRAGECTSPRHARDAAQVVAAYLACHPRRGKCAIRSQDGPELARATRSCGRSLVHTWITCGKNRQVNGIGFTAQRRRQNADYKF